MNAEVQRLESLLERVQRNRKLPRGPRAEVAGAAQGHAVTDDYFGAQTRVAQSTNPPPAAVRSNWPGAGDESLEDAHPSFDAAGSVDSGTQPSVGSDSAASGLDIDISVESQVSSTRPKPDSLFPETGEAVPSFAPIGGGAVTVPPGSAQADQSSTSPPGASVSEPAQKPDSLFPEQATMSVAYSDMELRREPLLLAKPAQASGPVAKIEGADTLVMPATFGELLRKSLALRVR
jgi:hypothetical protein